MNKNKKEEKIYSIKDLEKILSDLESISEEDLDSVKDSGIHLNFSFIREHDYVGEKLENLNNILKNCLLKINQVLGGNLTMANLPIDCLNILLKDPSLEHLALEKKVTSLEIRYYEPRPIRIANEENQTQQLLAKNTAIRELLSKLEKMVNLKKINLKISHEQVYKGAHLDILGRLKKTPHLKELDVSDLIRILEHNFFNPYGGTYDQKVMGYKRELSLLLDKVYELATTCETLKKVFIDSNVNLRDTIPTHSPWNGTSAEKIQEQLIFNSDPEPVSSMYHDYTARHAGGQQEEAEFVLKKLHAFTMRPHRKAKPVEDKYILAKLKEEDGEIIEAYNLLGSIPKNSSYYKKAQHMMAHLLFTSEQQVLTNVSEKEKCEVIIKHLLIAGKEMEEGEKGYLKLSYLVYKYVYGEAGLANDSSQELAEELFNIYSTSNDFDRVFETLRNYNNQPVIERQEDNRTKRMKLSA